MIDSHCHIEQKEYGEKLDEFILNWKKSLKFVVSSCAHVQDLDKTLEIYKKFKPFVQICVGLHPEYIKDISEEDIQKVIEFIKKNKKDIVAIGEVGLDYRWIKEPEFREKQKDLFVKFIELAKELDKPIVIHSRDSTPETIAILEQKGMQNHKVLFHLLQNKSVLPNIMKNNWFISIGPGIAKSKDIKKIARDAPLHKIMIETDSPWFKQEGQKYGEPTNVRVVLEKIAEIKHSSFQKIDRQTGKNAIEFFNLKP